MIVATGSSLELGDWTPEAARTTGEPGRADGPDGDGADLRTLEDVERHHVLAVLERTGWRVSGPHGAALVLGLKPTTLEARMKRLGIERPSSRPR